MPKSNKEREEQFQQLMKTYSQPSAYASPKPMRLGLDESSDDEEDDAMALERLKRGVIRDDKEENEEGSGGDDDEEEDEGDGSDEDDADEELEEEENADGEGQEDGPAKTGDVKDQGEDVKPDTNATHRSALPAPPLTSQPSRSSPVDRKPSLSDRKPSLSDIKPSRTALKRKIPYVPGPFLKLADDMILEVARFLVHDEAYASAVSFLGTCQRTRVALQPLLKKTKKKIVLDLDDLRWVSRKTWKNVK